MSRLTRRLMMSSEYPLKHIRLKQLHEAGFNVADFVCWAPGQLNPGELKKFLEKHKRISCRHFHADEKKYFKCPVLYDQTDFKTILAFCSEHNKTFYTLCNESINTQESLCAGNVLVHDENNWFIEYFYGPGTPRDVEKNVDKLKTYSKSFGSSAQGDRPPETILRFAYEARKFNPLNKAYILEFSLYPYPIGRQQNHIVCWEWRWGWLHYQLQANQFLLEELRKTKEYAEQLRKELQEVKQERGLYTNDLVHPPDYGR